MSENQCIGFIGSGNMGTALIKGMIQSKLFSKQQLFAFDKDDKSLKRALDFFGLNRCNSIAEIMKSCSIVLLCVKPQNMQAALDEIKMHVNEHHLIISIAAGITIEMIESLLGRNMSVIRVMPNTPALVQKGISALSAGGNVKPEDMRIAIKIFGAVGETVEVDESMMNAVTALSGSGPGFVFRIMECMVESGVELGLDRHVSQRLVVQTLLGSACLAKNSDLSLSGLREMVTSPGGTTSAGLSIFEQMGLESIVRRAIDAACNRSLDLGRK
ncbi:MAG TPA: pyrroline-5-carboxylate reductase [Desulfobacteraceae bacterium]|nr:pyrroline-5-carboxylate reductase [Desulfobacteraceae bacterium]HPJ66925.1 pyrroline-5-carboxylate reductase [Desulfobacteraceae bacterium]HPQ27593.1 pyrroline-5-carboxylate reductase [Desulfobacteraceae bacterium]